MPPERRSRRRVTGLLFAAAVGIVALADGHGDLFYLRDDRDRPLAGVDVSVVGRTGAVKTSPDGGFRLDPIPKVPFDLVAFDRSGAVIGTVRVASLDEPVDRVLRLKPRRVENVSVVSGVAPSTPASPAASATVLSRKENDRRQPIRLVGSLQEMPGAWHSGSGQTSVPTLRGLAGGRTLILIDDARVTTERRAGPSATYLNPFSLENIEVVRGSGSVTYGSDAIGGIIHARTPRPDPDRFRGRLELSAGAGQPFGSIAAEINAPFGSSALLAQAYGRSFGDYETPSGTQENSSARNRGMLLRGLVPAGDSRMLFGLQIDRGRDVERPASNTDVQQTSYPVEDSERLTFGLDLPAGDGFSAVELRAFVGAYRLVTERERFASDGDPRTVERSDVDAKDAMLRVVARRPVAGGTVRFGIDTSTRFDLHAVDGVAEFPDDGSPSVSEQVTIDEASRFLGGVFADGEWAQASGRVTLAGGVRGDLVTSRNRGGFFGDRSSDNRAVSGFAAVQWRPGGSWELSAQVARGFRDATLSDRYFAGTTARGRITGNPDLVPETSRQLDLALRGGAGGLRLAAFGYLYRIQDLIGRVEVAPGTDVFEFENRGEQEIRGFELEVDYLFSERWSGRGTVGYSRGELLDADEPAPDIPPLNMTLSVNHKPTRRVWWRLALRVVARDDRPNPQTEIETPAYHVLDAAAGIDVSEAFSIRFLLANLTDESYPWSADRRTPDAPGRAASVVLAARF